MNATAVAQLAKQLRANHCDTCDTRRLPEGFGCSCGHDAAADAIEAAERDAARYRWLRNREHIDIAACWLLPSGAEMAETFTGAELDAAIDALRGADPA